MPFVSSVRGTLGLIKRPFPISDGKGSVASTGGTITTVGGYRIHTFTATGNSTFTFSVAENIGGNGSRRSDGTINTGTGTNGALVEYLIVAGGAGGSQQHSGGGGAGGYLSGSTVAIAGTNTITVGAGGAAQPIGNGCSNHTTPAGNGGSSSAFSLTAIGGGYPGCYATISPFGGPNGSGGGGRNTTPPPLTGGPGTAGQGFAGGDSDVNHAGGGGGGAGERGAHASERQTGARSTSGGNGLSNSISGTATFYAGGGGGGNHTMTGVEMFGGNGGGGLGGRRSPDTQAVQGTDGRGGGGGGNLGCEPNHPGFPPGRGGNGVVIIRYTV